MSTHVEPGPRMPLVASALLGKLAENWWRAAIPPPDLKHQAMRAKLRWRDQAIRWQTTTRESEPLCDEWYAQPDYVANVQDALSVNRWRHLFTRNSPGAAYAWWEAAISG